MKRIAILAVAVALGALVVAGCGSGSHGISAAVMQEITAELTKEIHEDPALKTVSVRAMDCVTKDDKTARCFAKLHDADPEMASAPDSSVGINVTFDKDNGGYLWEAEA